MKINQNIPALLTINSLNKADNAAAKAMQRLSSGIKINSAKDNAAGLAIANNLDRKIKGLEQANRNVMDGISLVQTAEGSLNEVSAMLVRLKEVATQGGTDTYDEGSREAIQEEMDQLIEEIKSIQKNADFNGINLFDTDQNIMFQIGSDTGENISIDGDNINLDQVINEIDGMKVEDSDIQEKIDRAITKNSAIRGELGAYQNRLEHTSNSLGVTGENTTAALSRILDTDMALEMTNFTAKNIISQSATAILSQANQRPQQVLQLLNS